MFESIACIVNFGLVLLNYLDIWHTRFRLLPSQAIFPTHISNSRSKHKYTISSMYINDRRYYYCVRVLSVTFLSWENVLNGWWKLYTNNETDIYNKKKTLNCWQQYFMGESLGWISLIACSIHFFLLVNDYRLSVHSIGI